MTISKRPRKVKQGRQKIQNSEHWFFIPELEKCESIRDRMLSLLADIVIGLFEL
jgi:hypothetical protein